MNYYTGPWIWTDSVEDFRLCYVGVIHCILPGLLNLSLYYGEFYRIVILLYFKIVRKQLNDPPVKLIEVV
jgi:hypothetical protein